MSGIQLTVAPADVSKGGPGRRVGSGMKNQLLPTSQVAGGSYVYTPTTRTLVSTFPNNMFSYAGKKSSVIPRIDMLRHLVFKVEHTITGGPAVLAPCQYWIPELSLRDSGSGEVIQRTYDDTSLLTMLFRCAAGKQRSMFKSGVNMESEELGKYGLSKPLMPGTYTFFIPVLTSIFENFQGLFLNDLQGDLMIDWTTPNTIVAAGPGVVSSSTISFLVEGAELHNSDINLYKSRYMSSVSECRFLQAHRSEFLSMQLTAGQVNKLPLRSVDGLCAFQAVMVRPTGVLNDNINFNTWKLLNVGDSNGAAIDLTTNSGKSILGNGSPVPTRWLRQHQSVDLFDNDFITRKPVYLLNYCESINGALAGRINGGKVFVGSDADEVRISLPPAPLPEVQGFQYTAAPSIYFFMFRGERSALISGGADVGTIKQVIEAMREVKARNITVTASAVASAGLSFTLTFNDPEGTFDGDLFQCNMGNSVGVTTTRLQASVPGLVTGQYDVYVYSFLYNKCSYVGNKLHSELLV